MWSKQMLIFPHRIDAGSEYGVNKGYRIVGRLIDNPGDLDVRITTGVVLTHDETTGEIETPTARYTLLGAENGPEKA